MVPEGSTSFGDSFKGNVTNRALNWYANAPTKAAVTALGKFLCQFTRRLRIEYGSHTRDPRVEACWVRLDGSDDIAAQRDVVARPGKFARHRRLLLELAEVQCLGSNCHRLERAEREADRRLGAEPAQFDSNATRSRAIFQASIGRSVEASLAQEVYDVLEAKRQARHISASEPLKVQLEGPERRRFEVALCTKPTRPTATAHQ